MLDTLINRDIDCCRRYFEFSSNQGKTPKPQAIPQSPHGSFATFVCNIDVSSFGENMADNIKQTHTSSIVQKTVAINIILIKSVHLKRPTAAPTWPYCTASMRGVHPLPSWSKYCLQYRPGPF